MINQFIQRKEMTLHYQFQRWIFHLLGSTFQGGNKIRTGPNGYQVWCRLHYGGWWCWRHLLPLKSKRHQAWRQPSGTVAKGDPNPRGNNSWYPVYKRPWYPADIRSISLIFGRWIRSKHGCFLQFFKFYTLWSLSTGIWLIFRYIQLIFFNILPKSVR